ncbi:MAG TPA: TadE/TadG family type IV pilus assembly protein [Candidatus Limnocylindrales bacterium]|nr:TadE/TadG family type IV pilus assembly protein [Candidatus Limnocylindrales bacterium]
MEFALVVPWFFLMLFGIIEAGRFIYYYETLSNATREGARYAIVNGANTLGCPSGPPAPGTSGCDVAGNNVVTRVRQSALGMSGVGVTPTWAPDNGRGSTVRVDATFTYRSLVPIVPLPQITVNAESTLVVNN